MTSNAVATPHHLSAEAGRHILLEGGNAVDAAAAAVAAQGVVAPETCGLGGDLFALIQTPGWDQPRALNSSGRSGSKVASDRLRKAGAAAISRDDPEAVTIPGCVDGLEMLVTELGTLPLGQVLEPAIRLATEGFEVSTEQSAAFLRMADVYRDNPAVSGFYPGGQPVKRGDVVKRPELARTLEAIASGGREAFYSGSAGDDISGAVGGAITLDDMSEVQAEWVDPIGVDVAGLTSWTIPPNSQGYLGPGALAVFEMLEPPDDPADPLWWHLLVESYRCLAWERDDLVSDPGHVALPARLLLEPARLERAAATVDRDRAGVWPERVGRLSSTAYMCVSDADGMAVSVIQSNYSGTGSVFGAARSGFLLQDRGAGFTLTPGHPNELGPHKRPLHTLSPTLWSDADQPRWVLGTRGGAVQPQLIAQVAARAIVRGDDIEEAQTAPRWTVTGFGPGSPPRLAIEPNVPNPVLEGLRARGHHVDVQTGPQRGWGPVSIVEIDGPQRRAAADPRVDTTAAFVF
ncbi:MAG: gamma-glutamyltransferase family protein [Acidimicrobiia bacterium]